jgi:UDP-N-acetylglucosamine:LPS N-acetylglucosamine transferase
VPFPEFRPGSQKVLFFSRGRGRGHAVIDLELMDTLQRELPDLDVRFVSYAEGARQIADSKRPLIDLGLPSQNSYVETSVLAGRLIGWLQPDFVIAHEEFAVMPSAKIFDKPTLFLTDWFTSPDKLTMAALRLADHILFLDEEGIYEEPPSVEGRVTYCGPYLRALRHSRADKLRLREQLQIPPNATVLGVFPGSWREAQTPLADVLEAALPFLDLPNVYVVWIAGDDVDLLREKFAMKPRFLVREYEDPIDAWMAASDLAITKCNRKSAFELLRLGVPSVAISWGFNPIDDAWVRRHDQICWLSAASLTPTDLASYLQCAAAMGATEQPWPPQQVSGQGNQQILAYIRDWLRRTEKTVSARA